jgi:hypothetical protein
MRPAHPPDTGLCAYRVILPDGHIPGLDTGVCIVLFPWRHVGAAQYTVFLSVMVLIDCLHGDTCACAAQSIVSLSVMTHGFNWIDSMEHRCHWIFFPWRRVCAAQSIAAGEPMPAVLRDMFVSNAPLTDKFFMGDFIPRFAAWFFFSHSYFYSFSFSSQQ